MTEYQFVYAGWAKVSTSFPGPPFRGWEIREILETRLQRSVDKTA